MGSSRHSRHYHHAHHGHHGNRRKAGLRYEAEAHDRRAATSHRHAQSPERDPASYIKSWLEGTRPRQAISTIQPVQAQERAKTRPTTGRRGRPRSADSSIITPAPHRHKHSLTRYHALQPPEIPAEIHDTRDNTHKKRPRSSPSVRSGDRNNSEEKTRYEKRARHKTREDRYEPNYGGAARRKTLELESKSKERNPSNKRKLKKPALATTEDLMDHFSSNAIHNDRLTIKPTMQAGIFRNSKVDKAPGDLTFGEMNFLKDGRPQEAPKAAPKSRHSDHKKNSKELDEIEVFFSHKKPGLAEPKKSEPRIQQRQNSLSPTTKDSTLHGQTRNVRDSSRATTCISGSSSRHLAMRHDKPPAEHQVDMQGHSLRKYSPIPDSVRQNLVDTGIYRPLSDPDRRGVKFQLDETSADNRDIEAVDQELGVSVAYSPDASESRSQIARDAYVTSAYFLPRLPRRPPQPTNNPKSGGGRPQQGHGEISLPPVTPWHDDTQRYTPFDRRPPQGTAQLRPTENPVVRIPQALENRHVPVAHLSGNDPTSYLPFDRTQAHRTVAKVHPVPSPANSGISSHGRGAALIAPQDRPPFNSRHPLPAALPQPASLYIHTPISFDAGWWLLNTSPHIRNTQETASYRRPTPRQEQPDDTVPQPYTEEHAREPAMHHQREVAHESMEDYIADLEQNVLGSQDENDPPPPSPSLAPLDYAKKRHLRGMDEENLPVDLPPDVNEDRANETYLSEAYDAPRFTPYFRQGPVAGFLLSRQVGTSDRGLSRSQSDRHSVRLQNSPIQPAQQSVPRGFGSGSEVRYVENDAQQVEKSVQSGAGASEDVMARYWKPNTYGL